MTDKEIAKKIAAKYQIPCHGIGDCEFESFQSAIEMAQWKDEQFNVEKASLVEKACELYRKDLIQVQNIITRTTRVNDLIDIHGSVDDFRKKLKKGGAEC